MTPDLSVYLVTDVAQAARWGRSVAETVHAAVQGGVTAVQIRDKYADAGDLLQVVDQVAAGLPAEVTLLVNDRVDVFLAARAQGLAVAGVHVGQRDLPVETVRSLIGPEALLGLTANTEADLAAAEASPARVDYVGIGSVRATATKPDGPPARGVDGLAALARTCRLPAVAIGGIGPADVAGLRRGGVAGVAVVSWICAAADPRARAAEIVEAGRMAA